MKRSPHKENVRTYNKLGKKYLSISKKIIPKRRLVFAELFRKGDKILDLGCGGGRDAKFFTDHGLKVVGVDSSPVLIKLAKRKVPFATFKCVDLLKMKFPNNSFDGIWAEAVLLHLERKDVPEAFKKLYKILKRDGLLHLTVKRGRGEAYVKEKLSGWNKRFYTFFSKSEMERMVRKQKFKIIYSSILPDEHKRPRVSFITIWGRK